MPDIRMIDLPILPDGGFESNDIVWLDRDNGDATWTSYRVPVESLLDMAPNIYNGDGSIPPETSRLLMIGEGGSLTFIAPQPPEGFGAFLIFDAERGLNVNGTTFNRSTFSTTGASEQSGDLIFDPGDLPRYVEIELIGSSSNGDNVVFQKKMLMEFTGGNTSIVGTPYELIMGDDTNFAFNAIGATGEFGISYSVESLDANDKQWKIIIKYT